MNHVTMKFISPLLIGMGLILFPCNKGHAQQSTRTGDFIIKNGPNTCTVSKPDEGSERNGWTAVWYKTGSTVGQVEISNIRTLVSAESWKISDRGRIRIFAIVSPDGSVRTPNTVTLTRVSEFPYRRMDEELPVTIEEPERLRGVAAQVKGLCAGS